VGQAEVPSVCTSEANEVLSRLKHLLAAPTDAALAKSLSISPQTLGSWRARARVPYGVCINLARNDGVSLDWLLLGRGAILHAPQALRGDEASLAIVATLQSLGAKDLEHVHKVALERKLLRELQYEVARLRNAH
jgi:hypothetical protein